MWMRDEYDDKQDDSLGAFRAMLCAIPAGLVAWAVLLLLVWSLWMSRP
jgi:hypothetical protein